MCSSSAIGGERWSTLAHHEAADDTGRRCEVDGSVLVRIMNHAWQRFSPLLLLLRLYGVCRPRSGKWLSSLRAMLEAFGFPVGRITSGTEILLAGTCIRDA